MENIAPSTLTPRKTVAPARIWGVSMLPPKRSGTSDERTSPPAGATPTVPSIGSTGSSMRWSLCRAAKATVLRSRSSS